MMSQLEIIGWKSSAFFKIWAARRPQDRTNLAGKNVWIRLQWLDPTLRSPHYYDHLFLSRRKAHTHFLLENPVNAATATFWNSTLYKLYNLTPFIQPLEPVVCSFSIIKISYIDSSFNFFLILSNSGCLLRNSCLKSSCDLSVKMGHSV